MPYHKCGIEVVEVVKVMGLKSNLCVLGTLW